MTRCTICRHEDRQQMDEELVAGTPLREMERQYRVSKSALIRHRDRHLGQVAGAGDRRREMDAATGEGLWERMTWMRGKTTALVLRTERKKPRVAMEGLRQLGRLWTLEQQVRRAGAAAEGEEALRLKDVMGTRVLAEVLKEHPDAEKALLEAVERLAREDFERTAR